MACTLVLKSMLFKSTTNKSNFSCAPAVLISSVRKLEHPLAKRTNTLPFSAMSTSWQPSWRSGSAPGGASSSADVPRVASQAGLSPQEERDKRQTAWRSFYAGLAPPLLRLTNKPLLTLLHGGSVTAQVMARAAAREVSLDPQFGLMDMKYEYPAFFCCAVCPRVQFKPSSGEEKITYSFKLGDTPGAVSFASSSASPYRVSLSDSTLKLHREPTANQGCGTQEAVEITVSDIADQTVKQFAENFVPPRGFGFKTLATSGAELDTLISAYRRNTAKAGTPWRTDSVVFVWNLNEVLTYDEHKRRTVPFAYRPKLV